MKIMFLVGTYWPNQDGVSHVTQYLAEGLAKRHEVLVISQRKSTMDISEEHNGVKIERIHVQRNPYWQCVQGDKKQAQERVKQYQPDVLIAVCVQNWGYDWFKKNLDSFPGKKVLMTHGCSCLEEYSVLSKIGQIKFRRQILADLLSVYVEWYWERYQKNLPKDMEKFDLVTYLYDKDELYLYMRRFPMKRELILENATDDFFFERKAYLVDEEKSIVFINVSNYEQRKNQKLILRAFYDADIPDAGLVLIGSQKNEYYNELVSLNNSLDREGMHKCRKAEILSGLKRQEVLDIYKNADIYVSASSWEAMSISICEAAAAGLVIISTDVGHVSKIPGVYLFKEQKELSGFMQLLYENPQLRREKGRMASDYAETHYRIHAKVEELEYELKEL